MNLNKLKAHIDVLIQEKQQVIIAIDGSCASGKTTLANVLRQEYDCNVFPVDEFFLRPEQRTRERLEEIGGNLDYERFRGEVLEPLLSGKGFSYRPYDCGTSTFGDAVTVFPKKLNVIEGSYSHHPYFGDVYDLRVFLTVQPEVRRERILKRPAFLHQRFFEEWIPMEQRYFEHFSIREKADFVLDTMVK